MNGTKFHHTMNSNELHSDFQELGKSRVIKIKNNNINSNLFNQLDDCKKNQEEKKEIKTSFNSKHLSLNQSKKRRILIGFPNLKHPDFLKALPESSLQKLQEMQFRKSKYGSNFISEYDKNNSLFNSNTINPSSQTNFSSKKKKFSENFFNQINGNENKKFQINDLFSYKEKRTALQKNISALDQSINPNSHSGFKYGINIKTPSSQGNQTILSSLSNELFFANSNKLVILIR